MANQTTLIVIGLIVVIAVLSILALSMVNSKTNQAAQYAQEQPIITTVQKNTSLISTDNDPSLGSDNAYVTIVEFGDFQCSFCAKFHKETFPLIKKNYIDTGKVRFVYRDFPITSHQFAQKAAEASECADEQENEMASKRRPGIFWEYVDILFKNQDDLSIPMLERHASTLGLNIPDFNKCLESGAMRAETERDGRDGTLYGVTGTPYFFVNNVAVDGAYPYAIFETVIEQELTKQ